MKKLLPILNIIGLLATVAISYLSMTGIFNGNTMATQSARYPTLFTPAPWAFSIWGLIYITLGAFVIFQVRAIVRPRNVSGAITSSRNLSGARAAATEEAQTLQQQIGGWFLLSCIANSCWVIAWMYDQAGLSVLIMIVLLFSLFKIILRTDMELTDPPLRIIASVWWPFCLYAGWITVALLANISAWLVKIRWDGIEPEPRAIIMTLIAGAVYLFMTWRRNMREYGFVGVWALIAVAMADRDRAPVVTTTALIVAGVLFVSSSVHGYRNRAYSPFRKR